MAPAVWLIIIILAALYALYRKATWRFSSLDKDFPGPKGVPILGNAFDFMEDSQGLASKFFTQIIINLYFLLFAYFSIFGCFTYFFSAFYRRTMYYAERYKSSFRIWVGPIPYVDIIDPVHAEVRNIRNLQS